MEEKIEVKDNVRVIVHESGTNKVIEVREIHNFITKPGLYHVLDRLRERSNVGAMSTTAGYCSVGTGSVNQNLWAGSLTTEVSGIGNSGRSTVTSVSRTSQTILISTFFDSTKASGNITECGLFVKGYDSGGNLQTPSMTKDSGVLLAEATFNPVTSDQTNSITIDWEIIF